MGKEMKERSSNTLASQPKPAIILPKTVEQARLTYLERIGLVSDLKHIDLLFLANQASVAFFGEVVVAPEESLTGRVEKHAWKQREAEEAKHPSNGCREEKRFEKKYVRRKKMVSSKEHMEPTSTSNLVQKSSSLITMDDDAQREQGLYNNGETHSKSEQAEAAEGQGRCSGIIKNKFKGDDDQEEENIISEAGLNQAVLESDILGEEMIASESEEFLPLLEEAETEEEDVSNASRCNQWWNFKTRPRTSRGVRRHVQWSNKRKRNCMSFEETQRNRKILILAVEAITHQLDLLDVGMEEKSSYK
ncbi:hypothetical protein IGI04_034252 [Brassica rapa subsp. trilocularis]|uniref:Uncharacterized protein n=2 Tax=Brassica TaxID=3705 RepID=A0ABQ7L950_BRACM|nr:hypothetical protein IGI04_034252 [Brassica rapa subsp. trilocularis]